jgi:hypothetical protein
MCILHTCRLCRVNADVIVRDDRAALRGNLEFIGSKLEDRSERSVFRHLDNLPTQNIVRFYVPSMFRLEFVFVRIYLCFCRWLSLSPGVLVMKDGDMPV